jgi:hypothetical protein
LQQSKLVHAFSSTHCVDEWLLLLSFLVHHLTGHG